MPHFLKSALQFLFNTTTRSDRMLILAVLLLSCLSLLILAQNGEEGEIALVEVKGRPYAKIYLSEPQVIKVAGKLGELVIVVENQRLRITDSSCPQKVCVHTGAISHRGEILVCAPNHVVVHITGEKSNPFDLITQ